MAATQHPQESVTSNDAAAQSFESTATNDIANQRPDPVAQRSKEEVEAELERALNAVETLKEELEAIRSQSHEEPPPPKRSRSGRTLAEKR